jgi:hypothetical protein
MSRLATLVLSLLLALAGVAVVTSPVAALDPVGDAVTTTTLAITPSGSARVGQQACSRIAVSAEP